MKIFNTLNIFKKQYFYLPWWSSGVVLGQLSGGLQFKSTSNHCETPTVI